MIRKPTEKDFKAGVAVTALLETKRTAVESGNGLRQGVQGIARLWVYGMFWFAILTAAIPVLFSGSFFGALILIGVAYAFQLVFRKGYKVALPMMAGEKSLPPTPLEPAELFYAARQQSAPPPTPANRDRQSGDFKLTYPRAMRQITKYGLAGFMLLILSPIGSAFLLMPGIALVGISALIVIKLFSDRDLLFFDHRSITVHSLLGKTTLDWNRVADLSARTHSRWNLKILFMIGTRRAIVVKGLTPQGAVIDLLIPMDLLDLDKEGLIALVTNLLCCRAAAGEVVPSWQTKEVAQVDHMSCPSSDSHKSFDPDAIIARHLAERQHLIEQNRAFRATALSSSPITFGRKR